MNYLEWNKKLYDYFFQNAQPVIYLSLTKKVLADLSCLNETEAFEDFKTAINTFPSSEAEKARFPFLVNKINNTYLKPSTFLQKASNFKKAWRKNYQYLPGPMLGKVCSWPKEKEPPYIGYLTALVLMLDDSGENDKAFWKNVEKNFEKNDGDGHYILELFEDLKSFDNRLDFYSMYAVKIYVGTLYSQMPLTVNEIKNIKFFFVLKDISYDNLLQIEDDELFILLLDDLDTAFANERTIEALHTDDVQYKNFKIALPYILKRLIPKYAINQETIEKALELMLDRKAAKEYNMLLSFGIANNSPLLPFRLILKHGKYSELLEQATDGAVTITNCEGILAGSACRLKITAERDYSYPTSEGLDNEGFNRNFFIKNTLNLQVKRKPEKNIIVFVPGSHYNINGYWIESPNKVVPVNEICYLVWRGDQNETVNAFLENCIEREAINNHLLPEGWNLAKFSGVMDHAILEGFDLENTKSISLIGGCKADPYRNEYFNFCPPRIDVTNFSENFQFTIKKSNRNTNINVPFASISNAIIDRVDIDQNNNRNKFLFDDEITITPENEDAPYASFVLRKSKVHGNLNSLCVPTEIHYPKIEIRQGNLIDNTFQQDIYCIQNTEQGRVIEYNRQDPNHESSNQYKYKQDYVLYALSHKREFTYGQAETTIESFSSEKDNIVPYYLMDAIFTQGHIQEIGFNANFKDKKFTIVKPRLAKLPSQSNLYQLIGARSYEFMQQFINNANDDRLPVIFLEEEFKLYPQKVLIRIGTANTNHKSCEFYIDSLNKYPGVSFLNSLKNYRNILLQTGERNELTEMQGYSFQKFDQKKLVFNSCQLDTVNHQGNQTVLFRLVRTYRNHNIPELYFLKKDNTFYPVNSKQDAIYSFLAHTVDSYMGWIYFNKKQKLLAIPAVVNFPENLRRSLSLLGCFSSIHKVQKSFIQNNPVSFLPHIANEQMIPIVDEENHTKIILFENVHDFIAEIIENKLNKPLIRNIDLSNLQTINND